MVAFWSTVDILVISHCVCMYVSYSFTSLRKSKPLKSPAELVKTRISHERSRGQKHVNTYSYFGALRFPRVLTYLDPRISIAGVNQACSLTMVGQRASRSNAPHHTCASHQTRRPPRHASRLVSWYTVHSHEN